MDLQKIKKLYIEKKLTPAELAKREEIAKAMERENPGMGSTPEGMAKKMAIATATAKRVAEDVESLDEVSAYNQVVTYYRSLGLDPYKLRGAVGKQIRDKIKASPAFQAWQKINRYESVEYKDYSSIIEDLKGAKAASKKKVEITFFGYPDSNTVQKNANTSDPNYTQTDSNFITPN